MLLSFNLKGHDLSHITWRPIEKDRKWAPYSDMIANDLSRSETSAGRLFEVKNTP